MRAMTESTAPKHPATPDDPALDEATVATLEALDDVLDELREHREHIPQWEFCEGFLTALLCTRRPVPDAEWLPVLLGIDGEGGGADDFDSPAQRTRFLMNWQARQAQIEAALDAQVESLDDPRALNPAVIDWRGMLLAVPEETDTATSDAEPADDAPAPAFARVWAAGFLVAVDQWADDWAPPRDKEIAADMADALEAIADLDADDTAAPVFNLFQDDAPPSVSQARMNLFGDALWAVYDLHAIARSLGPRVAPVLSDKVGRNDPCPCGSGKKYKKCCGA